ncbi:hypothetical protein MOBT1_002945 [Malassezia obtusa]|uniref:Uncharacterized protein n=1 Tax=Malassezia obtusa TaxID=76774 RepID=A0AAF0E3A3_9BASI|nr:hypothetical protein MOBT1_002945 [Malassezia obtusa]
MATASLGARIAQFVVAALVAILALKVYESRNSVMMMHTSARLRFPAFWVRTQPSEMGTPTCRNVHGAYVEDARAFSVDPATGHNAQTTDSCEDVQMSTSLGIAIFSCDPGRMKWNAVVGPLDEPHKRGALWVLDYKNTSAEPYYLHMDGFPETHDFHPLGMSILDISPKLARLFVVNHRGVGNTLEVIDLQKERGVWLARYTRTIYDAIGTHAANSVQALEHNEVLVTNMHTAILRSPPLASVERTLERLYGTYAKRFAPYFTDARSKARIQLAENVLGGGWVSYISFSDRAPAAGDEDLDAWGTGVDARVIAQRIPFANGLAVTPGHRHVVVASTTAPGVVIFPVRRWTEDGEPDWRDPGVLGQRTVVPTPFFADNLEVLPPKPGRRIRADDPLFGATILVAGHPSLPDFEEHKRHFGSEQYRGASWAVEIAYTGETESDAGVPFSADSRVAGLPQGWSVRTLMQTDGRPHDVGGHRVELPTSCGVVWDNTGEGLGTLIVSGLYSPAPLVCRGMYA